MKIDLSGESDLLVRHREWLDEIARDLRRPFTEFIERLSEPHGRNIDWWVTPVASRNTFASSLFFQCCQLMLARRIAQSDPGVREITVDSPALARTLRNALAIRRGDVRVHARQGRWRGGLKLLARMAFRLVAACFRCLGQATFARVHAVRSTVPLQHGLILIDTFLYSDSLDQAYRDRHYPGLAECLGPAERGRVFFVPTYYRIRNYSRLFRRLRRSETNFLIKEDYLRWRDYGFALAHPFRLLRFRVDSCNFQGIEVALLINDALMESFASSGTIEGLLRYRFARRLAERGVRVKLAIDWFENQELDHGSNAGLREFLPETVVVGYQGFVVPKTYLCLFPTRQEAALRLVPHKVAVMGPALATGPREFCPDIEVIVAPAFRFTSIGQERRATPRTGPLTILVPLPFLDRESEHILSLLGAALSLLARPERKRWRVLVKPHPIAGAAHVTASLRNSTRSGFEIVSGDIEGLLRNADVLVSNASSVCVHSLVCGVPVAVVGNSRGLTQNPIPDWVENHMWALCHSAEDLGSALDRLARRDEATLQRYHTTARALREGCVEPVTPETVARFLGLDAAPVTTAPGVAR